MEQFIIAFDVLVHITKWRNNRQCHSDTFQEAKASAKELVLPKAFASPQYVSGLNPHQTLHIAHLHRFVFLPRLVLLSVPLAKE